MQDILKLKFSGVTGKVTPLIDIYLNDELSNKNVKVTADFTKGETNELTLKGDYSDLKNLRIEMKNDLGAERVNIEAINLNGVDINPELGSMTRDNGTVYENLAKMHWNGNYEIDLQPSTGNNTPTPPSTPAIEGDAVKQFIELDLTSVRGSEAINVYVNGELVEANHIVNARMSIKQSETLRLEVDAVKVEDVVVEFFNDSGSSRVELLDIRVNNSSLNLGDGTMVRSNGDVHEGLTKMYWNGKLSYEVPTELSNAAPVEAPNNNDGGNNDSNNGSENADATQEVSIELAGVQGTEKVDIYVNGELVKAGHTVTARMGSGKTETLKLDIATEEVDSVSVDFFNDSGSSRVNVHDIAVNGNTLDLGGSSMTRANGDVHEGLTTLYWNGKLDVEAPAAYSNDSAPSPSKPPVTETPDVPATETGATQHIEIDVNAVHGNEALNVYVNGELLASNFVVRALMTQNQKHTIKVDAPGEVKTLEVEFVNDAGSSRVDILGIRVNNNEVDLSGTSMTRTNGDVYEGLTKMYWNGKLSADIPGEYNMAAGESSGGSTPKAPSEPAKPAPTEKPQQPDTNENTDSGSDNDNDKPDETPVEVPVDLPKEDNTDPSPAPVGNAEWGGIDTNMHRGDYAGRSRDIRDESTGGETLFIKTGTSASQISKMIENANPSKHLTVEFAEGEHWFNQRLLVERGDITIKGAGEGKTTFVADFANGKVDNLIQIQGDDIRLDNGSNNGRWMPDQSDYVGTATQSFSLGDRSLNVSSTKGLSVGDTVMVYKQGTASKNDDDNEHGSMAEIIGINGNELTFKHSLAFGSDMLARGQSLNDVKIYELDLLENVNVHDFSIRYNVTKNDLYNPNNMAWDDILNTTEFNYFPKYAVGGKSTGEVAYGHQRALVLSGTHEANIFNVTANDVGSHAFFFSGNLELFGDSLTVDGVYNKGVDGNGYGVEYDKTYYSDFVNLDITNVRHSVSAHMLGGNGFNNFHVEFTDSNMDFHGGRDQGNIYYVENMEYEAEFLPKLVNGKLTGDINYGLGKFQFELIDYRQDSNASENTVIWKNVSANNSANNDGGLYNEYGEKMAAYLNSNDDILVAGNNGANIDAGYGNDILVSGKGNDVFTGGANVKNASHSDMFIFEKDNGQDVITDFETAYDKIIIDSDVKGSAANILKSAVQSGNDVILDFGKGNSVTLQNTNVDELNTGNVGTFSDLSDFGM